MDSASSSFSLAPTLFSTEGYQNLNGKPVFSIQQPGSAAGLLLFFKERTADNTLRLQLRAPFVQGLWQDGSWQAFADVLAEACHRIGSEEVIFTLPPALDSLFTGDREGYAHISGISSQYRDLNYHLPTSSQPFAEILPSDQRRALRRSQEAGILAQEVGVEALMYVHQILARNRAARGFHLSITYAALVDAYVALPGAYRAYLATGPSGEPIGAAVVVQVTPTLWYTYLLGHLPGVEGSPVLHLLEKIWEDAQAAGIHTLDLGTASLHGEINEGVAAFKRSLGAIATSKPSCRFFLPDYRVYPPSANKSGS